MRRPTTPRATWKHYCIRVRLSCRDVPDQAVRPVVVLFGGGVEALMLAGEVKRPVGVEVAVVVQGREFEDGLGALEVPATAGDHRRPPVVAGVGEPGPDRAGLTA